MEEDEDMFCNDKNPVCNFITEVDYNFIMGLVESFLHAHTAFV